MVTLYIGLSQRNIKLWLRLIIMHNYVSSVSYRSPESPRIGASYLAYFLVITSSVCRYHVITDRRFP